MTAFSPCPESGNNPFGYSVKPDPKLIEEGWILRSFLDSNRAKEAEETYASLGFEVRACPVQMDNFPPECSECAQEACKSYVMIYTRKD